MAMELQGDSGNSFFIYHTDTPPELFKACGYGQVSINPREKHRCN